VDVGIDVAKAKMDVFIGRTGESFSVVNAELEIRRMLKRFAPDDFVILEATVAWKRLLPAPWPPPDSGWQ
jgi:transposase